MNKNSFLTFILAIAFLFTLPLKPGLDENQDDGFPYWTLVQTDKGDKKLCFLKMSDKLISLVDGSCAPAEVIKAEISEEIRDLYAVYIEDEVLLCGGATRFFVIEKNNWVKAIDLRDGDHLVSNKDNKPQQVVCRGCQVTCIGIFCIGCRLITPPVATLLVKTLFWFITIFLRLFLTQLWHLVKVLPQEALVVATLVL